jgi:SNF2 family DNA or RNA helicase
MSLEDRKALLSVDGMTFDRSSQMFKLPLDVECMIELGEVLRSLGDRPKVNVDDRLMAWMAFARERRDKLIEMQTWESAPLEYELRDKLYPFQQVGVAFMAEAKFAMNNDVMGLGKTVQTIAAIREMELTSNDGEVGRYLLIVPNNALGGWARHVYAWHPPTADGRCAPPNILGTCKVLQGGDPPPGFYIINWEKISLRLKLLLGVRWDGIVADESHRAKNRKAQRTKALLKLDAGFKFMLSGTPIRSEVADLWPQLHFLMPERFTSYWSFVGRYVEMEEVSHGRGTHMELGGTINVDKLRKVLRTVVIGRTDGVDLPERTDIQVRLELGKNQRRVYKQMLEEFVAWISDTESEIVAANWMSQILRLKQITGSLGIFSEEHKDSVKIDWLMDKLEETVDEKFVVMSQFVTMLTEIGDRLIEVGICFAEMTGDRCRIWDPSAGEYVNVRNLDGVPKRERLMGAFQRGQGGVELPDDLKHLHPRVFLITTQTGGESVTLTAARYFVFTDLLWTPGENEQARKRVHRISQDRTTFMYELLAEETIDVLKVLPTLRRKQEIIDAVLGH